MKLRYQHRVWDHKKRKMYNWGDPELLPIHEYEDDDTNFTVMQCIGVTDMHGMPIYDKDIYINPKSKECGRLHVTWSGGAWCAVTLKHGEKPLGWDDYEPLEGDRLDWMTKNVVVIGNYYETKVKLVDAREDHLRTIYGKEPDKHKVLDEIAISKFCEGEY